MPGALGPEIKRVRNVGRCHGDRRRSPTGKQNASNAIERGATFRKARADPCHVREEGSSGSKDRDHAHGGGDQVGTCVARVSRRTDLLPARSPPDGSWLRLSVDARSECRSAVHLTLLVHAFTDRGGRSRPQSSLGDKSRQVGAFPRPTPSLPIVERSKTERSLTGVFRRKMA